MKPKIDITIKGNSIMLIFHPWGFTQAKKAKVNGKIRIFLVSVETQQIYLIAKALILASFYSDLHTSYTMHSREIK